MPFRFLYRRAARTSLKEGKITEQQYDEIMAVLRHPIRRRRDTGNRFDVLKEIEKHVMAELPKEGAINWDAIIQWLKDNWVDILKLILTIAVFLEPLPKTNK